MSEDMDYSGFYNYFFSICESNSSLIRSHIVSLGMDPDYGEFMIPPCVAVTERCITG